MLGSGHKGGMRVAAVVLAVSPAVVLVVAVPVAAQESVSGSPPAREPVLVAPVQGSEALRTQHADRVASAVRQALEARGHDVTVAQESLGHAVVACQTPECVEQALDAAGVAFAIVPALWSRTSGGEELTLTLLQRTGRSLNASGAVGDDLPVTAADLIDELFAKRLAAEAASPSVEAGAPAPERARAPATHPHAWRAGPILLIAGGAAAFVAIGVAAGVKSESQQLDSAAVAAWSTVGAAAIAGGIAWWVVGEKQRRKRSESASAASRAVCLRPTGIDLKLRF
jgi:hypothetical protein